MFADTIFTHKDYVLSSLKGDLAYQFVAWREFGYKQLRNGDFPLWNPYIFSGMPYFGESQSALLYPLNLPFLFLPIAKAVNVNIALHVFLMGIFMYSWGIHRGLRPASALVSASLTMFCGPYFLFVSAGNLPNICTMPWIPLVFLSIDGLFEEKRLRFCLLGIFATAMLILAGHFQYIFLTGIAGFLYVGMRMFKCKEKRGVIYGLVGICTGSFGLAAAQIFSSVQAAQEGVRSGGLSFASASMFSFPPENIITLFIPGFFGDNAGLTYWGRWYFWEASFFFGVTGLMLAVNGIFRSKLNGRNLFTLMAVLMFILALGSYTPLFKVLFKWLPGFNLFRGSAKFIFYATMFLALLAGLGLNQIAIEGRLKNWQIVFPLVLAVLLVLAALCIKYSTKIDLGFWKSLFFWISNSRESFMPVTHISSEEFAGQSGIYAFRGALISAGLCAVLFISFLLLRKSRRYIDLFIAFVAIAEIFIFAITSRPVFRLSSITSPEINNFAVTHQGDNRILNLDNPNLSISLELNNIWGNDPGVLKRYAEFIAFTQSGDPDAASSNILFTRIHPLFRMLGLNYVFLSDNKGIMLVNDGNAAPRVFLAAKWELITERDRILKALEEPGFDLTKKVILEVRPNPLPIESEKQGEAHIVDSSTDHVTVHASVLQPSILVIANNYSRGWRVSVLEGAQKKYSIIPANYILQAIPLSEGRHTIRIEYMPWEFVIGKYISITSLIVYIGLIVWHVRKNHMYK